jgi:preprotein translocase subunit YajC
MKNTIFYLFIAVISLGIGFYGGVLYQKNQQQARFSQFANLRQGQNRLPSGMRPISGEIIKKDEDSLTVKLRDGSTKIVFLTEKTTISKSTTGSKEDLQEKINVFILGQQNSDGSITAENIQINPKK